MFLSTKEIIFFILIFVITFLVSSNTPNTQNNTSSIIRTIYSFIFSLVASIILMLVYKYTKIPNCDHKDNFNFEVTPEKLCQGGPYMYSSAPKKIQDYCNNLFATPEGRQQFANVICPKGYTGQPLCFQYTPESNDKWENTRCDSLDMN